MFHVEQKKTYIEVIDHLLTKEKFKIKETATAGLLKTDPTPTKKDIVKYYKSEKYVSHNSKNEGLFFFFYRLLRAVNFYSKYRFFSTNNANQNVLDFGSGEGYFLSKLQKKGFKTFGVEPTASTTLPSILPSIFNRQLDGQKFNYITAWHSVEHVHDLQKTVARLHDLLDERGTLLVAAPNYLSFDAKYYKSFWAAYDAPRHLWHFDKTSLKDIFKNNGFRFVKSSPMFLDAYYVSLLSESYKKSTFKIFKSILVGTTSNILGLFTKEYSSNIFVFKKTKTNT